MYIMLTTFSNVDIFLLFLVGRLNIAYFKQQNTKAYPKKQNMGLLGGLQLV